MISKHTAEVTLSAPTELHQGEEIAGKIQVSAGAHEVTVSAFCLRLERYSEGEDGEDQRAVIFEHRAKGCGAVSAGGHASKSFRLPALNAPLSPEGVWWKLRVVAILSNAKDAGQALDVRVLPPRRIADLAAAVESQLGWHRKSWAAAAEPAEAVEIHFAPVGTLVEDFDGLVLCARETADGLHVEAHLDREEKGAFDYLSAALGGDIRKTAFTLKDAEVYQDPGERRKPRQAVLVHGLQAFLAKEAG